LEAHPFLACWSATIGASLFTLSSINLLLAHILLSYQFPIGFSHQIPISAFPSRHQFPIGFGHPFPIGFGHPFPFIA
jgi:hypothetical protein